MNLNNYELDDFISDESFQNWVLKKGPVEHHTFWEQWTANHPEKEKLWKEAREVLSIFNDTNETIDPSLTHSSWEALRTKIESGTTVNLNGKRFRINRYYKYAAIIAFAIIALTAFYTTYNNSTYERNLISHYAGFGERKEITLPDGSVVVLNANSELQVHDNWNHNSREIWLEKGEAFFMVTKQEGNVPFTVHTEHLDVMVLGTAFNVNLRRGNTKVMLKEGKVKLSLLNGEQSIMNPGDLAEYTPGSQLQLIMARPGYLNWLNGKIVFDNTPLNEIALFIEDHYGVLVDIESEDLRSRTLSGELPNDNLNLLLNALRATMDVTIKQESNEIVITKSKAKP